MWNSQPWKLCMFAGYQGRSFRPLSKEIFNGKMKYKLVNKLVYNISYDNNNHLHLYILLLYFNIFEVIYAKKNNKPFYNIYNACGSLL